MRLRYSARAPREAPGCPQRSRPESQREQDPGLLCGEAIEAGRGDRGGQVPARAVTEELESFQLTRLANGREDGEKK